MFIIRRNVIFYEHLITFSVFLLHISFPNFVGGWMPPFSPCWTTQKKATALMFPVILAYLYVQKSLNRIWRKMIVIQVIGNANNVSHSTVDACAALTRSSKTWRLPSKGQQNSYTRSYQLLYIVFKSLQKLVDVNCFTVPVMMCFLWLNLMENKSVT